MLRLALVTLLVGAFALPARINPERDMEWNSFKVQYQKVYEPTEELLRRMIWESNLQVIEQHNLAADQGKHTYWLGVNAYADMTNEEFVKQMNGYNVALKTPSDETFMPPSNVNDLPPTVDWRTKGYVTGVKDQKQCGSCWAFSATGSLEGQHFKKTGTLTSLSEQNLVDCSGPEGNLGCDGGLMDQAFTYIKKNKGIDTEISYPYEARDDKCRFNRANVGATDMGFTDITSGSEKDLQMAVATVGPISVAIDASHDSFQLYKHGVYNEPACSSTQLDHGVLAVGYGMDGGVDYWLVKNSWGLSWGMKGYIMMSRNKNNQCGIATASSYPRKQCGSCWAFSATGSLEGQHFKKNGTLTSLSEQNLVDCSRPDGNHGCNGGWMDQAFTYIKKNKGIDTEMSYPYEAIDEKCRFNRANVGATDMGFTDITRGSESDLQMDGKCRFNRANVGATVVGYTDITRGSEKDLQMAVATVGPISVAIDASHDSFHLYKSGVYNEPACSSTQLDHAVLAVGYGMDGGLDYWLVKNSWGLSWGMKGYIMMSRNKNNQCGIATASSYPRV